MLVICLLYKTEKTMKTDKVIKECCTQEKRSVSVAVIQIFLFIYDLWSLFMVL